LHQLGNTFINLKPKAFFFYKDVCLSNREIEGKPVYGQIQRSQVTEWVSEMILGTWKHLFFKGELAGELVTIVLGGQRIEREAMSV
jgi:hypothetical protein